MRTFPIIKDGFPYILTFLILSILFYFIFLPLFFVSIVLLCFVVFFFRNPQRQIPADENIIVSPADGKIMYITEIDEPSFLNSKAIKISIFLSVFNVHINRSPIEGVVRYINYRPGKFLPAFKSHASDINERNSIGIEGNNIKVLVHQITGFIARRIVCWSKEGTTLQKGERFGLIKFGSCTEIIVPTNVELNVNPGDVVKGGKTIIGVVR